MIRKTSSAAHLGPYSIGMGDRFGRQGKAQLSAVIRARDLKGVQVTPVWNKSFREHSLVGTVPADVRREANAAAAACRWKNTYFVDADHVGMKNVDSFLVPCDFFTIDVADFIGLPTDGDDIRSFLSSARRLAARHSVKGLRHPIAITPESLALAAGKYLPAVREAQRIYKVIEQRKGKGRFVAEISMDETDVPQSPGDLLVILAAASFAGIPVQTIAPKFSGRFNKGVEYSGDIEEFTAEFRADLAVCLYASKEFSLPPDLKLSVHSGSDKFALYPRMAAVMREFGAGVHLKTAGTTWLEEVGGLAAASDDGLAVARDIYAAAFADAAKYCAPYKSVIDIDARRLPAPGEVAGWTGARFAATLKHDEGNPLYNPHFRQLMHVSYPAAAAMGRRFTDALDACSRTITENVIANLCDRHIVPLFC